MDETCATPGAHWMHYPYACPTDYLYWPARFADEPGKHGPDLPRAVKARSPLNPSA